MTGVHHDDVSVEEPVGETRDLPRGRTDERRRTALGEAARHRVVAVALAQDPGEDLGDELERQEDVLLAGDRRGGEREEDPLRSAHDERSVEEEAEVERRDQQVGPAIGHGEPAAEGGGECAGLEHRGPTDLDDRQTRLAARGDDEDGRRGGVGAGALRRGAGALRLGAGARRRWGAEQDQR